MCNNSDWIMKGHAFEMEWETYDEFKEVGNGGSYVKMYLFMK